MFNLDMPPVSLIRRSHVEIQMLLNPCGRYLLLFSDNKRKMENRFPVEKALFLFL